MSAPSSNGRRNAVCHVDPPLRPEDRCGGPERKLTRRKIPDLRRTSPRLSGDRLREGTPGGWGRENVEPFGLHDLSPFSPSGGGGNTVRTRTCLVSAYGSIFGTGVGSRDLAQRIVNGFKREGRVRSAIRAIESYLVTPIVVPAVGDAFLHGR